MVNSLGVAIVPETLEQAAERIAKLPAYVDRLDETNKFLRGHVDRLPPRTPFDPYTFYRMVNEHLSRIVL